MTRYFAFLRAINAGPGHTVKMLRLIGIFESMGFKNVGSFEASGNIIFESTNSSAHVLEAAIEEALKSALGFDSATFLRTGSELANIARCKPFEGEKIVPPAELNVIFLKQVGENELAEKLSALKSEHDEFRLLGREIYWWRSRLPDSGAYSTVPLERTLKRPFTVRSERTVRKMVEKLIGNTEY
jgi:uncharacterized protein (DUF1697 family)